MARSPTKKKTYTLSELEKELLRKPGVRAAYDELALEFQVAHAIMHARQKARLTQTQLARKMGTRQSFIARIESGATLPSMTTLRKVAKATGTRPRFALDDAP